MSLHLDIHAIQSVPASNINRDRSGAPKSGIFGGVRRHQVSSQSWKRAIRRYLRDEKQVDSTYTSREFIRVLASRIADGEAAQADIDLAAGLAVNAGLLSEKSLVGQHAKARGINLKPSKKAAEEAEEEAEAEHGEADVEGDLVIYKTGASFPFTERTIEAFVEVARGVESPIIEIAEKKSDVTAKIAKLPKADVDLLREAVAAAGPATALFGSMFASAKDLSTDAAAQVAFAVAVHETAPQVDFYTAVDDLSTASGGSMMGTKSFDASVLYRYANLDLAGLRENLDDGIDPAEIAASFVEGFLLSMPTGAQNGYAARTLPSAVVVVASERPKSLANAFLEPIEGDFIAEATRRLVAGERTLAERVEQPKAVWRISLDGLADAELGEQSTLAELLDGVRAVASEA